MLVNNLSGDLLGLERALAPGLAGQTLAQKEAEISARQFSLNWSAISPKIGL